ncbi:hypothetical protein N0V94_009043 [Neodidymelliopsis sp. IMI 364377]|nr:hypothetical protein N0V94_009043 [Neodidymelliopsis sp. IMI 364377]
MTSCSLVANGLVSQYNGQVPTFSYRQTGHSDDYFGIQMTYMNGASTCYSGRPSFTPVIQNTAAGFSVQCQFVISNAYSGIYCPNALVTNIPNGVLTVSYKNCGFIDSSSVHFERYFALSVFPDYNLITELVKELISIVISHKFGCISFEFWCILVWSSFIVVAITFAIFLKFRNVVAIFELRSSAIAVCVCSAMSWG